MTHCRTLRFSVGFEGSTCKLFEVDEEVLEEILKNSSSVYIKGAPNDEAVVCTSDKTFVLRLAESSNSFMLAPGNRQVLENSAKLLVEDDIVVESSASANFELVRTTARMGALRPLLLSHPYGGDLSPVDGAEGFKASPKRSTLAELDAAVQCSHHELRAALISSRALEVAGAGAGWCVMDEQLEIDILDVVISLAAEHGWPLAAVPASECVRLARESLTGVDELAVRHCLRTHSVAAAARAASAAGDGAGADGHFETWQAAGGLAVVALDLAALAKLRARALLKDCDSWPFDGFIEAWLDALPEGAAADTRLLDGLAVRGADGATLIALPLERLPSSASERLEDMFKLKRAWTIDELAPYVSDLLDPGRSVESFMLQHARTVIASDGARSYVPRFA